MRFIFTLCGGHISPILVGCKQRGLRVIDVRDKATTVFAAAVARLDGAGISNVMCAALSRHPTPIEMAPLPVTVPT